MRKIPVILFLLSAVILSVSCFDMYSQIHDGIGTRVGILLTRPAGNDLFVINGKGLPENRSGMLPAIASIDFGETFPLDYNHDGNCDLVIHDNISTMLLVLLNDGKGGFLNYTSISLSSYEDLNDIKACDLNGDGYYEFVFSHLGSEVKVLDSKSGAIYPYSGIVPPDSVHSAVADLNGDGKLDLYVSHSDVTNHILFSITSAGGYDTVSNPPLIHNVGDPDTSVILFADVDGDKDQDLLRLAPSTYDSIQVYANNGDGSFTQISGQESVFSSAYSLTAGDVDGDGDIDLMAGDGIAATYVMLNDGYGRFSRKETLPGVIKGSLFDVDFDGDLDYVCIGGAMLAVFYNDGQGGFTLHSSAVITPSDSITLFTYNE